MKIYYNVFIGLEDEKDLKLIATMPFYKNSKSKALKAYQKLEVKNPNFYKELVENNFIKVGEKTEVKVKILQTTRRYIVSKINPRLN